MGLLDNLGSKLRVIINIEGLDGTGKATISKRLKEILEDKKLNVFTLHFPQYETQTGGVVRKFLTGDLVGDPTDIDPILSSLLYTTDRLIYFKNNPQIFTDYDVLIFDRSYMSNFFFQTVKYSKDGNFDLEKVVKFIKTMFDLEIKNSPLKNFLPVIRTFQLYHPIIETNFKLMEKSGKKMDMHESNKSYLFDIQKNTFRIFANRDELLGKLTEEEFKAYDFLPIKCSSSHSLRAIDDIANNIIEEIDGDFWI